MRQIYWNFQFTILMQARLSYLVPRKKRIEAQKSVVRYDASNSIAYIIIGLRDDPQHFLSIKVDKITERQMKALPIFVLDYLMFYPGQEQEYLAKIQKHFSYPINIYNIQDINLDSEQIGRLRQDQSVMLYKRQCDSTRNNYFNRLSNSESAYTGSRAWTSSDV